MINLIIYYFCLGTSLSLEIKSLIAETPTIYTKFYTKNAILIILFSIWRNIYIYVLYIT
ncbi:hypothetical protein GLOIN_2v1702868 [Rhizophagus irregularis DAOM 181602=DAOM 197198]|nr:hypothetical protein GLOIN_2v1702868 [Rhizophagus irregularis DAOM 181602=DAOM 197198]